MNSHVELILLNTPFCLKLYLFSFFFASCMNEDIYVQKSQSKYLILDNYVIKIYDKHKHTHTYT